MKEKVQGPGQGPGGPSGFQSAVCGDGREEMSSGLSVGVNIWGVSRLSWKLLTLMEAHGSTGRVRVSSTLWLEKELQFPPR